MRRPMRLVGYLSEGSADWAPLDPYLWLAMQLTPRNIDHPLAKLFRPG
jgi:hypothetical protein